jgi:hypothetical protein
VKGKEMEGKLKDFANALFELSEWPDGGDIDLGDFQDLAVKYGLLVPEIRHKPCGESCNCEGYYSEKEFAQGITCYRKAEWLNADVDPRSPTLHAPASGDGQIDAQTETADAD